MTGFTGLTGSEKRKEILCIPFILSERRTTIVAFPSEAKLAAISGGIVSVRLAVSSVSNPIIFFTVCATYEAIIVETVMDASVGFHTNSRPTTDNLSRTALQLAQSGIWYLGSEFSSPRILHSCMVRIRGILPGNATGPISLRRGWAGFPIAAWPRRQRGSQ